ncbi:MAG: DegT/DnrJ/EryC1/StrS family aminotransferase [Spirochaetales bacterium]|nr:DegT/DnrJ/EryC1/StrS family aminotransferase [Spirochaetales bacterium]
MQFADLGAQFRAYENELRGEMDKVFASSAYINGPAVGELEEQLADFCGASHAIACASGTDALLLGLMAKDVQPGDEILVPAFTFIATASMVSFYRAVPIFVDVDPVTFNMNPDCLEAKITSRTKGIIPVSLYGQCPDMTRINAVAKKHGLWVMEDAAQSFGSTSPAGKSCAMSEMATTSFFPAKPLGGFGDGGAIFTSDDVLAQRLRVLRNHGQIKRYHHAEIGINGRMDTLQAAVLKVKLAHFAEEIDLRNQAAARYDALLEGVAERPVLAEGYSSTWAQYTVRVSRRDEVREQLAKAGIPSAVHYPVPLARQEAFASLNQDGGYPVSDDLSSRVLSLPMHAFITAEEQETVVQALKDALA